MPEPGRTLISVGMHCTLRGVVFLTVVALGSLGCARSGGAPAQEAVRAEGGEQGADRWVREGHAAFAAQDYERAARAYGEAVGAGADTPLVHFRYGYALHVTGRPGQALPHHVRATEIDHPALRVDALYNAACACALLGRRGEALSWFSRAIDAGFRDIAQVEKDSDLDSLRGDAEFQRLVEAVRRAAGG